MPPREPRDFVPDVGSISSSGSFRQDLEDLDVPKANYRFPAITVRNDGPGRVTVTVDDDYTHPEIPPGTTDTVRPGKNGFQNYEITTTKDTEDGDVVVIEHGEPAAGPR